MPAFQPELNQPEHNPALYNELKEKFSNNVVEFPEKRYDAKEQAVKILTEDLGFDTLEDAEQALIDLGAQKNQALEEFKSQNFLGRWLKGGDSSQKYTELEKQYNELNRKLGSVRSTLGKGMKKAA